MLLSAPLFFYVSPYQRAKHTLKGIAESLTSNHIVGAREEPRLTGVIAYFLECPHCILFVLTGIPHVIIITKRATVWQLSEW